MTDSAAIYFSRLLITTLIDQSAWRVIESSESEFSIDLLEPIDQRTKEALYSLPLINDRLDITIPDTTGILMVWINTIGE